MTGLPKAFFVTGTDTGVGKTVVSAILTLGLQATYWKPIQSGLTPGGDSDWIRAACRLDETRIVPEVYRLSRPLSPHRSALIDGVSIELEAFTLPETDRTLVVEGAGGLLVPLNDRHFVLDLICRLQLPVLLVARSGLGTINHTLLSLMALRAAGVEILGVVMNGDFNSSNRDAIERYGQVPVIAEVPPLPIDEADPGSAADVLTNTFVSCFSARPYARATHGVVPTGADNERRVAAMRRPGAMELISETSK